MMKRILSLLLAVCLVAGMLCTAAYAAEKPLYVALGDSIAAGVGLVGHKDVAGTPGNLIYTVPEGCFAKLIAKDMGYEVQNLAVSGDDTDILLERLQTKQYSEPLKKADVITVTIGSNDLLVKALDAVQAKFMPGVTDHNAMATPGEGALLNGSVADMAATLQSVNDYLNSDEIKTMLSKAVEDFKGKWDTIIDTLVAWNPDAELIVTNYYNPYASLDMNIGTLKLTVGALGKVYLDQMNAYVKSNSRNGKCYTIVDVTAASLNVKIDTAAVISAYMGNEVDLSKAINLDPHPDAAGHAYFAKQIEAMLKTKGSFSFPDVPSTEWYATPVSFAAEQKLVVGDAAGSFNPTAHMTLAQYLTVMYRYARSAAPSAVPEKATTGTSWMEAAEYVNTTVMKGAYKDLSKDMTRTQMAEITAAVLKLVSGATGKTLNTRETHGFTDSTDASVLYLESVYGLDGYPQGDGTYQFKGANPISRAEVAQVVYNIMTKSVK